MRRLRVGIEALQSGNLDEAEKVFLNILSLNSSDVHSLHFLGVVFCQKGNLDDGIALIEQSIRLDPSRFGPYLNLGRFLVGANRCDRAVAALEQAVQRDAGSFDAWSMLAQASFFAGDADAALKAGKRAAEIRPGNAEIFFSLGVYASDTSKDEAIVHYRHAVSIDPASFKAWVNLGSCLLDCQRVEDSIAAFNEALKVESNCFEALMYLSIARLKKGELIPAAESARKAISVKPESADAYFSLANVLKEEGELEDASASYKKAIALMPDFADAYINLGIVLTEEGKFEEATDAFAEHYRLKSIAQSVSFASALAPQTLNTESEVKVPEGVEFIPSYVSGEIPFGMHLMYVHIPKAGGLRFSNPIFTCIQDLLLKRGWEKYSELASNAFGRERVSLMVSGRIDSAPMRDGIMAAFSAYDLPALDFSFLTPHGVSFRELSLAMRDRFGVQPIRLATWRDPRKRLKSALDYLYRTSEGDLDLVNKKIDQKDPFLDNAIYRACFSDFSSQLSINDREDAQVDHLIDIGDFSVMNRIMSSFLSRCRLPNVIVNKGVNVTSADKRMDARVADALMEQCVGAGFISLDYDPVIGQMISRELPSEFDLHINPSSASLHPLTFVVSATTDVKTSLRTCLLPTEYLMDHEAQEFLRKTFSE